MAVGLEFLDGGQGALLAAVLRNKPKARRILLDLPHVVRGTGTPRCGGNRRQVHVDCGAFFLSVLAGGDVYHQHLFPFVSSSTWEQNGLSAQSRPVHDLRSC